MSNKETALRLVVEKLAPDLPTALLELADHLGSKITLTFIAEPGQDEADVSFIAKKVTTEEPSE